MYLFHVTVEPFTGDVVSASGVAVGYNAKVHSSSITLGPSVKTSADMQFVFGPHVMEIGAFARTGGKLTPSAGKARLWVKDNGSDKMRLMMRFPTGPPFSLRSSRRGDMDTNISLLLLIADLNAQVRAAQEQVTALRAENESSRTDLEK